ncbi:MAG: hypothetical protein IIA03_03985 [Proteobacteria bacterium]|nr:hypothetical protein [Pseudomonadota bacterium]
MKQLAGLDASFLYLETPQMPMHVGALHLLQLPAGYEGDYVRELAAEIPGAAAMDAHELARVGVDLMFDRIENFARPHKPYHGFNIIV